MPPEAIADTPKHIHSASIFFIIVFLLSLPRMGRLSLLYNIVHRFTSTSVRKVPDAKAALHLQSRFGYYEICRTQAACFFALDSLAKVWMPWMTRITARTTMAAAKMSWNQSPQAASPPATMTIFL